MVSRETSPSDPGPVPAALAGAYPAAVDGLAAYALLLTTAGVERGLIGPREVPRLWDRHLLNCAVVERLIDRDASVADVGSGAGLPGLVLALVRPDLAITLVEPLLRRSTFLAEATEQLGLVNVDVVRSRVEDLPKSAGFDVVTSRAVAPLDKLTAWCAPILAPGGRMLAMKGERAQTELAEADPVLSRWKLIHRQVRQVGADLVSPPTVVVELSRTVPPTAYDAVPDVAESAEAGTADEGRTS